MEDQGSARRSNMTANRRVQHALVKRVFIHWCIFVGVVSIVTAVMKSQQPAVAEMSWSQFWNTFCFESIPFLVVTFSFLPAFLFDSHRISFRFAGPMVRFRRSMADIVNGQTVAPINFRPGDFWHDIAVHFNQVNDRFKAKGLTKIEEPTCATTDDARTLVGCSSTDR